MAAIGTSPTVAHQSSVSQQIDIATVITVVTNKIGENVTDSGIDEFGFGREFS